jgi:hypothetical protein
MFTAIDNATKKEVIPFKNGTAICKCCGSDVIAKCGTINIHHWAHKSKVNCDSWYEPMTQWHKDWQGKFNSEWREKLLFDECTGEKHIADIHTPSGITIEIQHSPISIDEFSSRCDFYKKLIWVIDGRNYGLYLDGTTYDKFRIWYPYGMDGSDYIHGSGAILERPFSEENQERNLQRCIDVESFFEKLANSLRQYYNAGVIQRVSTWNRKYLDVYVYDIDRFYETLDFEIEKLGFVPTQSRVDEKRTFKSIFDNDVKLSAKQIGAKGKDKLSIPRQRHIYRYFYGSNVFIDNVEGMSHCLFYWNKEIFVPKSEFIKKYSL